MERKELTMAVENKVGESSQTSEECDNYLRTDETILKDESETTLDEQSKVPNNFSPIHKTSDFRQTAKYKDSESYGNQHHHSIGTGLYLTDEIHDLPPRFRNKVIAALKNAAALNKIPLDCDPLKLLCSVPDDSEQRPESSDSLVTLSTLPSYIKIEDSPRKTLGRNSTEKKSSAVLDACISQKVNHKESVHDFQPYSNPPDAASFHKRKKTSFDPQHFKTSTNQHSSRYSSPVSSSDGVSDSNNDSERLKFYAKHDPKYPPTDSICEVTNRSFKETSKPSKKISNISNQKFDLHVPDKQDLNPFVGEYEKSKIKDEYCSFLKGYLESSKNPPSKDVIASSDGRTIASKTGYKSNDSYKNGEFKRSDSISSVNSYSSTGKSGQISVGKPENLLPILFPDMDHNSVQNYEALKDSSSLKYSHENSISQKVASSDLVGSVAKDEFKVSSEGEKRRKMNDEPTGNRKQPGYEKHETGKNMDYSGASTKDSWVNFNLPNRNKSNKNFVQAETGISPKFQNLQTNASFHSNASFNESKFNQHSRKAKHQSTPHSIHPSGPITNNFNEKEINYKSGHTSSFDKYGKNCDLEIQTCNTSSNNFPQTNQYMPSDKGTADDNVMRQKSTKNASTGSHGRSKFSSISSCETDLFENGRMNQHKNLPSTSQTSRASRNILNSDSGSVKESKVKSPQKSSYNQSRNEFKGSKSCKSNFDDSSSFKSDMSSQASTHSINIPPVCNSNLQKSTTTSVNNLSKKVPNEFFDRRLNEGRYHNGKEYSKFSYKSSEDYKDKVSVSSETISQYSDESKNSRSKYSNRNKNTRQNRSNTTAGENDSIAISKSNLSFMSKEDNNRKRNFRGCIEDGFFLKVEVSEEARNLEYWVNDLKYLFPFQFDVERCCQFADVLTLTFDRKEEALSGLVILTNHKKKMTSSKNKKPHVTNISTLKYRLTKPCDCRENIIEDSILSIEQYASSSLTAIHKKIDEIEISKENGKSRHASSKYKDFVLTTNEMLKTFKDSKSNFLKFRNDTLLKVKCAENLRTIQQLKLTFVKECNTFKRCLPIYSKKEEILKAVRSFSVSVIIAETGSGKSTQLVEYLLHSKFYSNQGLIICTQPRKLAAISIAQFVSGQIGSVVGKIVGYDVGIEKKRTDDTKVLYMTDYCLLKTYLRNKNLKGVSYVIIDEAHERSLYTDLLFGMLKKLLPERPDLRVIITSATINPDIFIEYFDMKPKAVVYVPGRTYPVDIVWWLETVDLKWNYVQACVDKAYEIHRKEKSGDILVFLTSPQEADEAINMFKTFLSSRDKKSSLFCLHGKSDIKEQMQVFQTTSQSIRKIIFATNVAETAVTIPGIKYVIDSGMTKELMFDPKKNKSYLAVTFISKSSAEQRKGRAGRTQSGVCYRMYSMTNFDDMAENSAPDMLKTNLQKAMLKIFELGIEPESFDFIEAPPKRTISNSIDSLEYLGAIENKKLTNLGKKLVKLPLEPQLSKLIVLGVEAEIGYETIVIASMVSEAGKLFIRFEDNRIEADEKKKKFCQDGGDLITYLEVYKRWKEVDFRHRFEWCVKNFVSSKALNAVANTVREITIILKSDLGISVNNKYSNAFKKTYERVIFDSFSENLCISSGHPKSGYMSPFLPESFFIHPSSTLSYLGKDAPECLVYSTLMETSRNFLFDITPISEETIKKANEAGTFTLPLHSLKCLQSLPIIMGPFGESVLIRHILGKNGSKIKDLETRIRNFTKTKNVQVDVAVDRGLITIYIGQRYHEKIAKDINEIIEQSHLEMLKEEDVVKLSGTSLHYALGAGGLISDIIMPGEFRELIVSVAKQTWDEVETRLRNYGPLQNLDQTVGKQDLQISATYCKVFDAKIAFSDLSKTKYFKVVPKPYLPNVNYKTLPLYMLDVSWCRCPCIGTGWVAFDSEGDFVQASDILTRSSFFLDSNYIIFSPSSHSTKELRMKNLTENSDEKDIEKKLQECLPEGVKPREIKVLRKRSDRVCDADIKTAKEKLVKLFSRFTPPTKLIIDMKHPKSDEIFWKASVYFESFDEGEEAYQSLKNNETIDSFPLLLTRVLKSTLCCKKEVYFAISKHVKAILSDREKKGVCEKFFIKQMESTVRIGFLCVSVQELTKMRQELMHLLQGESLDFIGISKYHFLFSKSLVKTINSIGESTKTYISFNKFRKVITIHGLASNIKTAKEDIYKIASNPDLSYSRVFNLLDSCIPAGFLKSIYTKYGYDLHGLVDSFELTIATIDIAKNTLSLTGKKKGIKQAEQALEKICEELYETKGNRQKVKDTQESCPICLEPVAYDFLRLEHCGHAFCRQCLLLQLESKIIPLVCVKQNCEKLIFVEDLKRIISHGSSQLKKLFCAAALQYHVSSNIGKISYCPTPDCPMIYRVTKEGSEYNCSECRNSVCTRCHTTYHYGMSCDMFQLCQKDEDYSLKVWMKENKSDRKCCPSCNAVIEKVSGCNHMECINCKAHLCWLCLKVFPESELVYDHMPFCKNNQS